MNKKTHYRTCNLCEAMCGLKIEYQDTSIISIKGDENDPFSQGHICPKAVALQDLYEDPDRLKQPLERTAKGWQAISWKQAFAKVAKGLDRVQKQYGDDAVGVYLGNPNVHNLGGMLTIRYLLKAINSRTRFSATSVDQLPHHIISMHLFGHQLRIPVPDVNRTDHWFIWGANPVASNGSIMTVAGVKQKIKEIKARGGKVVVMDPRRTETAELATEHQFVLPGKDVWVLLAMVREIFSHEWVRSSHVLDLLDEDLSEIKKWVEPYSCDRAAAESGVKAEDIKRLIREFVEAPTAVMYGRMGVSVQEFGLLSQYLIMLINVLTGRLDVEGGLMFARPAIDVVKNSGPGSFNRRQSRVRGLPDFNGEFPASVMSEEILTEGEGQIKAMVTVAGNPVLSTPNGSQLDEALTGLDFMVSVDYYLNETTRHANIILPPVSPLERDHYDMTFHNFAVHNTSKYSSALFKKPKGAKHDWEIYFGIAQSRKSKFGWQDRALMTWLQWVQPSWIVNKLLGQGPYPNLSLKSLKSSPHGIDLGPLTSQLPAALRHKDKKIHLNSGFYFADLTRLEASARRDESVGEDRALLIGRRHVRTNNSWMHNSHRLVKGKNRCTALLHPSQAQYLGLNDGDMIEIVRGDNLVVAPVQISEEVMQGVVSLPHGWGHTKKGTRLAIAQEHAGVSVNDVTDENWLDALSGNAAVNGVPVVLRAANSRRTENPNDTDANGHTQDDQWAVG